MKLISTTVPDMSLMIHGSLWHIYKVTNKQLRKIASGTDVWGLCLFEDSRILISAETNKKSATNTLFHELTHAALAMTNSVPGDLKNEELVADMVPGLCRCIMAEHKKIEKFLSTYPEEKPFLRIGNVPDEDEKPAPKAK